MSTNFYLKSGKRFKVSSKEALDIHERLPLATYTVGCDCSGTFFLDTIDSFEINHKLYGNTNRYADRIMNTFNNRDVSTGVLLTGEKGSGKTLLAKRISILAASQGIPTIVINTDYCGEQFNKFLQMIEQPVIILFDEFEKVYARNDKQEKMLTLLDGVYSSKKLFLLTCNSKWGVNRHMLNRPGRIYYALDYDGVDDAFIREYCNDNLNNKEHIQKVCAIASVFGSFNFDMLKAMVEEMNRYNENPAEVLQFLNARRQFDSSRNYTYKLLKDGVEQKENNGEWSGCPLKDQVQIYLGGRKPRLDFTADDLEHVDTVSGMYCFVKKDGYSLELTPKKEERLVNFTKLQSTSKNITVPTVSTAPSISSGIKHAEESDPVSPSQSESNSENDSGVMVEEEVL